MRLDHIAYRVADRHQTAQFFMTAFGYHLQTEFEINFDDGSAAKCLALEPPEKPTLPLPLGEGRGEGAGVKVHGDVAASKTLSLDGRGQDEGTAAIDFPWSIISPHGNAKISYHLAPEIFISDGDPQSIVGQWVAARGGIGGIHHLAYQVDSVEQTMREWQAKGFAEFSTDDVLRCPDLVQVFTKPSQLTGVIYEFIERGKHGFCADNVKNLMTSTKAYK